MARDAFGTTSGHKDRETSVSGPRNRRCHGDSIYRGNNVRWLMVLRGDKRNGIKGITGSRRPSRKKFRGNARQGRSISYGDLPPTIELRSVFLSPAQSILREACRAAR